MKTKVGRLKYVNAFNKFLTMILQSLEFRCAVQRLNFIRIKLYFMLDREDSQKHLQYKANKNPNTNQFSL